MRGDSNGYCILFHSLFADLAGVELSMVDLMIDVVRWRRFDSTCHRHALNELCGTNGACETQDE